MEKDKNLDNAQIAFKIVEILESNQVTVGRFESITSHVNQLIASTKVSHTKTSFESPYIEVTPFANHNVKF